MMNTSVVLMGLGMGLWELRHLPRPVRKFGIILTVIGGCLMLVATLPKFF